MAVSRELYFRVLARDRICFLARPEMYGSAHICRDQWGNPHPSDDLSKLTLDHFHLTPGGVRGKRAPDSLETLVAMCWKANVDGPSHEVREAERAYSHSLYG